MNGEAWVWAVWPIFGTAVASVFAWARRRGCFPDWPTDEDPEAERAAWALLDELLPEGEKRQLRRQGYLKVTSPTIEGREYRIPRRPGKVDVFESGKLVMRLCVEPAGRLPSADIVLMHKILIEADERGYLETANVHWMSRQ